MLKRISALRWIYTTLRPANGYDGNTIAALQKDRGTQAFLTGELLSVEEVNNGYASPVGQAQLRWNRLLNDTLHAVYHPSISAGSFHGLWNRVYPRCSAQSCARAFASCSRSMLRKLHCFLGIRCSFVAWSGSWRFCSSGRAAVKHAKAVDD